jgi:hypothetical protein
MLHNNNNRLTFLLRNPKRMLVMQTLKHNQTLVPMPNHNQTPVLMQMQLVKTIIMITNLMKIKMDQKEMQVVMLAVDHL